MNPGQRDLLAAFLVVGALASTGCPPRPVPPVSEIAAEAPEANSERSEPTMAILQIRGTFEPDGSALRLLHPLRRLQRPEPAPVWSGEGTFRWVIEYEDGSEGRVPFDAFMEDDSAPGQRLFGGFVLEIALPTPQPIASMSITDAAGGTVYASWTAGEVAAAIGEGSAGEETQQEGGEA